MTLNTQTINAIEILMQETAGHAAALVELIDRHVWDGERDILSIHCDDEQEIYTIVTTDKIFKFDY